MPKIITFGNQQIIEPGAYTTIQGTTTETSVAPASFGKVIIVDTGSGGGYNGGAGVNGQYAQSANTVYAFNDLITFRKWIRGGLLWDIAQYIFTPENGETGAEQLLYIKAATTTAATKTLTFVNGTITVKTVAEGTKANGTTNLFIPTLLEEGFAMKLVAGIVNPAKYILQFWKGGYSGNNGTFDYNGVPAYQTASILIAQSPESSTIQQIVTWMLGSSSILQYFQQITTTGALSAITPTDLTNLNPNQLFAGATQVFNASDLDDALEAIVEEDFTFFLCDQFGITDGKDVENTKIFNHILTAATYEKFMIVGGGKDSTEYDQTGASSFDIAEYYNNARVFVVHSNVKRFRPGAANILFSYSSLYHAAMVVGRQAGLQPQVTATWKSLSVVEPEHILTKNQRERALLAGVMHLRKVQGKWVINQEINTLVPNEEIVYSNGTSPEGSIMRIASNLNKEIKLQIESVFVGANANTANPADVKAFVEGILIRRTATRTKDDLILSFRNVTATINGLDLEVRYEFVVNSPVNRVFVTGVMLSVGSN